MCGLNVTGRNCNKLFQKSIHDTGVYKCVYGCVFLCMFMSMCVSVTVCLCACACVCVTWLAVINLIHT